MQIGYITSKTKHRGSIIEMKKSYTLRTEAGTFVNAVKVLNPSKDPLKGIEFSISKLISLRVK